MDLSSSNCYFWLCICNYRRTFCCGNGFEFTGILEVWSCALASTNFYTYINRECFFFFLLHLVGGANGRSELSGIWLWSVRRQVLKEVLKENLQPMRANSHVNGNTCAHSLDLDKDAHKHILTNTHQTWAESTFCLGRDDKLLAAS